MPAGRPRKFKSPRQVVQLINTYFKECDDKEKKYTVTGLARALGITRETLLRYEDTAEFTNPIKAAKTRIEEQVEEMLLSGKSPAGPIFWLKNFGWTDKQELDINDISHLTREQLLDKLRNYVDAPLTKNAA